MISLLQQFDFLKRKLLDLYILRKGKFGDNGVSQPEVFLVSELISNLGLINTNRAQRKNGTSSRLVEITGD